jgi:nicotinamidase-related amidase
MDLALAVSKKVTGKGATKRQSRPQLRTVPIQLCLRTRGRDGRARRTIEHVDPRRIGIVTVDAWHYHWCRTWRNRASSLIPRFNHSFDAARKLGITLIFSPTEAMRDLHASPQRKNTLAARNHPVPSPATMDDPYPGALRRGGCECGAGESCYLAHNVNNQHPDLWMDPSEYVAVTQQEVYNILQDRGITHVIFAGFAANICLWNKPTGLKFMRQFGFRCMVARDLTEAITHFEARRFNPTQGTLEVIELIERELAPSISLEETLRRAHVWDGDPVLDHVHISPWGRFLAAASPGKPILVELTCRHRPGARLHYTLDGTDPTPASPRYTAPIQIGGTCVLKAAGFRGDRPITLVSTAEYWKLPPVPPLPDVFISDLEPVRQWTGEPKPGAYAVKKLPARNQSVDGHTLTNRDERFDKGIGTQAPTELVFAVQPDYKRLVALAGVDDACMRWDNPGGLEQWPQWSRPFEGPTSYRLSQVVMKVLIDGELVAETPPLLNGDRAWGIDVAIPPGARYVHLVAEDVNSPITDAHGRADWLNAGFLTA